MKDSPVPIRIQDEHVWENHQIASTILEAFRGWSGHGIVWVRTAGTILSRGSKATQHKRTGVAWGNAHSLPCMVPILRVDKSTWRLPFRKFKSRGISPARARNHPGRFLLLRRTERWGQMCFDISRLLDEVCSRWTSQNSQSKIGGRIYGKVSRKPRILWDSRNCSGQRASACGRNGILQGSSIEVRLFNRGHYKQENYDTSRTSAAERMIQTIRNLQKTLILQLEVNSVQDTRWTLHQILGHCPHSMALYSRYHVHSHLKITPFQAVTGRPYRGKLANFSQMVFGGSEGWKSISQHGRRVCI